MAHCRHQSRRDGRAGTIINGKVEVKASSKQDFDTFLLENFKSV